MTTFQFRPHGKAAQAVFDAIVAVALRRPERNIQDWIREEPKEVWQAACCYAAKNNLQAPTLVEVERAELYAQGSADYAATWAAKVAERMTRLPQMQGS